MKTRILFAIAFAVTSMAFAQKKEVKAIEKAIKSGSYGEAKSLVSAADALLGQMDEKTKSKFMLLKAQSFLGVDNKNVADLTKAGEAFKALMGTKLESQAKTGLSNVVAALVNAAVQDQNTNKYSDAGAKLEKAYAFSDDNRDYQYFAASNYLNSKEYDKAAAIFEDLMASGYTGQVTEYYAVNAASGEEKKFENKQERDLVVLAKEYVKPSERLSESRENLIREYLISIYSFQDKNDKALAMLDTALEQNPNDVKLLTSKSNIYLKMDKKDEYRAIIEKVLQIDPNNAELHYNLGVTADQQGDDATAVKYYNKAIELDPSYSNAYNNLGALILRKDATFVDQMNSLGTSNADFDKYEALKVERKANIRKAVVYMEKVLELKPDNLDIANNLLNLYQVLEDTNKADAMKAKIDAMN